MAILAKCKQCEREGGYAFKENDTVCARCKMKSNLKEKDEKPKETGMEPKKKD